MYEALSYVCMRPYATSVCGLELLVYAYIHSYMTRWADLRYAAAPDPEGDPRSQEAAAQAHAVQRVPNRRRPRGGESRSGRGPSPARALSRFIFEQVL